MEFLQEVALEALVKGIETHMKSSGNHPELSESTKKTKRNRRPTECNVIRRTYGCGICGSENLAYQGVNFCEVCGLEVDSLTQHDTYYLRTQTGVRVPCDCKMERVVKNKVFRYRRTAIFAVTKCLDCGAVMSRFCPNCKVKPYWFASRCWKAAIGRSLYCRVCGFRC